MLPLGNMGQNTGNDLLSREIPVSSALEGLTAVFGMGTGVPPPLKSPELKAPRSGALSSNDYGYSLYPLRRPLRGRHLPVKGRIS